MKLSEYRSTFYEFSGLASDRIRAVALGGLAIAWIFKLSTGSYPELPKELYLPVGLFGLCLLLDLLQYVVGALIWFSYYQYQERKHLKGDPQLDHPSKLVAPIHTLFALKIIAVIAGYLALGAFLLDAWVSTK
jgi:hypothetical protein